MREGGREGELECLTPKEHAALDGVVVHSCVCVCVGGCVCMPTECDELHWPWPRTPLSIVFVAKFTRVGVVIPAGDTTHCVHQECQCEQSLLNLAFDRFHLPLPNVQEDLKIKCNHNNKNTTVNNTKCKMEVLMCFSSLYSSSGVISEVCLCI